MKKLLLISFVLLSVSICSAQKSSIDGQWRGYFSGGGTTEYVIDFSITDDKVNGISITTFERASGKIYVTCELKGSYDSYTKKLIVTETRRLKTSAPTDFEDCLQTHIVTYKREKGVDLLEGYWKSAPGYFCGTGKTIFVRKKSEDPILARIRNANRPQTNDPRFSKIKESPKNNDIVLNKPRNKDNVIKPPVIIDEKENNKTINEPKKTEQNIVKNKESEPEKLKPMPTKPIEKLATPEMPLSKPSVSNPPTIAKANSPKLPINTENRLNKLQQTFTLKSEEFTVSVYDNGDIDGDIISLYYNNQLVKDNILLSDKPTSIKLKAEKGQINELVMYAKNLGSIPPNTAYMVINDGDKQYTARISSDESQNGTIRFIRE